MSNLLSCLNNKYYIHQEIGSGSFAKVSKGVFITTGTEVAIKRIEIRLIKNRNYYEYIFRELDLMRRLQHPNIVYFYESIVDNKNVYMIFEYCSEGDLSNYLDKVPENRISETEAHYLVSQLINAMDYLHEHKIIHRDIKPQNILLHRKKELIVLKLADFGFAKELKDIDEIMQSACGTPLYMAPEVLKGGSYTVQADLWAIGLIIYEMVIGSHPFPSQNIFQLTSQISQDIKFSSKMTSLLSSNCINLLKGLIQRDPDKRLTLHDLSRHPWIILFNVLTIDSQIKREIDDFCIIEEDTPTRTIFSSYEIFDDWEPKV